LYNVLKEVIMAFKCPRCSEVNKDGSAVCWSCHTVFATGERLKPDIKSKGLFKKRPVNDADYKKTISEFPNAFSAYLFAPPKERLILVWLTLFFLALNIVNNFMYYHFQGITEAQDNAGKITAFMAIFIGLYSIVLCIARLKADTDFPGKAAYLFYLFFIPIFIFGYIIPSFYPNFRLFVEGALLIWIAIILRP